MFYYKLLFVAIMDGRIIVIGIPTKYKGPLVFLNFILYFIWFF